MEDFQNAFATSKQSFISAFSFCMTVPLILKMARSHGNYKPSFNVLILFNPKKGCGEGQFDLCPLDHFPKMCFLERGWNSMTISSIISSVFLESFIKTPKVIHWFFGFFDNFLLQKNKWTQDITDNFSISYLQPTLNRLFNNCIKLYRY